jgi:hypothetical protein
MREAGAKVSINEHHEVACHMEMGVMKDNECQVLRNWKH